MRTLLSLAAVLVLLGPAAADEQADRKARIAEAKQKIAAEEAALAKQVNEALDKGIAWLKTQQKNDGSYPGFGEHLKPRQYNTMDVGLNALVVLTLAHGGVEGDDPAIKKCLNFCRTHYSGDPTKGSMNLYGSGKLTIYTAATLIVALDAVYRNVRRPPKIKVDKYGNPKPPKPAKCRYPKSIHRWIQQMVDFIVKNQERSGGWRYPGNPLQSEEGDTDLSNTQYALLALRAAAECGIKVPVKTWQKAAEHVLREQEEDGLDAPYLIENEAWEPGLDEVPRFVEVAKSRMRGWCYLPGHVALPTGSMTAAGITCLGILKERLWVAEALDPKLRTRLDRGLLDGLLWLAEYFSVKDNPEASGAPAMWHYYYLYGLERMGSMTGVRYVGTHDWYQEGARELLGAQTKEGGWPVAGLDGKPADHTESAITQTCFAILFLERTTPRPPIPLLPPITGGGAAPSDGR